MHPFPSNCVAIHLLFVGVATAADQSRASPPAQLRRDLQTVSKYALRGDETAFSALKQLTDEIGPRLTGSMQEHRAGQWALVQMRKLGLSEVHAENGNSKKHGREATLMANLLAPCRLNSL
jgi:hypothetical protein